MARNRCALLLIIALVAVASYSAARDHHTIIPHADAVSEIANHKTIVMSTLSGDDTRRKHDEKREETAVDDKHSDEGKKPDKEEREAIVEDDKHSDADKKSDKDTKKSDDKDKKADDKDKKADDKEKPKPSELKRIESIATRRDDRPKIGEEPPAAAAIEIPMPKVVREEDDKHSEEGKKPDKEEREAKVEDDKHSEADKKSDKDTKKSDDKEKPKTTRPNELKEDESKASGPATKRDDRKKIKESTAIESAVPQAAPALSPSVSKSSQAPVAVSSPTPMPATIAVSPGVSIAGTNTSRANVLSLAPKSAPPPDTVVQSETSLPLIQNTSELQTKSEKKQNENKTNSSATTSTDAVAPSLGKNDTIAPRTPTIDPTRATTSTSPRTPSTNMTEKSTPVPAPSKLSGSKTTSPVAESKIGSPTVSPGHIHASSSADVDSNDYLDTADVNSSNVPSPHDHDNRMEMQTSSDAGVLTTETIKGSNPDTTGSNEDNINGLGPLFNPAGVSDVKTSSATYYKLDTGSIVAIVGVMVGLVGILVLLVTISRKKYTEEEDKSPLPFGYDMKNLSVPRHSPTFMEDHCSFENGPDNSNRMAVVPSHQLDAASSFAKGVSSDEAVVGIISARSRVPSMHSAIGDLNYQHVRGSALYSTGSSLTSSSAVSGTWSSVLASDTERYTARNTRDTSLSAWSSSYFSSSGSKESGASGFYRRTRSSSVLSSEISFTGSSGFFSRSFLRSTNRSTDADRVALGPIESNRSVDSTEV